MKNLHSKNLKRKFNIFFGEFPTSKFIFAISLQKKIEPRVFVLTILQLTWQNLAIACKSFDRREKYSLIIGI